MAYRNNSSKFWTGFLAVLLVLVIAGAAALVGVLSDGFKNWDKFKPDEEQTQEGGAVITEGESNGIKLMSAKISPENYDEYGISPMAETAYQLTATIMPENATNKAVDWTIAWAGYGHGSDPNAGGGIIAPELRAVTASSESWVDGKTVTDYVTVTPTSDGALTANVECLQAFGAQVKITVTSRDNTSVKATATVDYTEKLSSVKATFGSTVLTDGMTKSFDLNASGQAAEAWKFDYTTSAHTIADEYTTTVKISFADGVSAVESAVGVEFTWAGETITSGMPSFDKTFFDKVFVTESGAVSSNPTQYNKLVSALSAGVTLFEVEVSTTGEYGNKTDTYTINVASDGLNIRVEGIELGDTSIIF